MNCIFTIESRTRNNNVKLWPVFTVTVRATNNAFVAEPAIMRSTASLVWFSSLSHHLSINAPAAFKYSLRGKMHNKEQLKQLVFFLLLGLFMQEWYILWLWLLLLLLKKSLLFFLHRNFLYGQTNAANVRVRVAMQCKTWCALQSF